MRNQLSSVYVCCACMWLQSCSRLSFTVVYTTIAKVSMNSLINANVLSVVLSPFKFSQHASHYWHSVACTCHNMYIHVLIPTHPCSAGYICPHIWPTRRDTHRQQPLSVRPSFMRGGGVRPPWKSVTLPWKSFEHHPPFFAPLSQYGPPFGEFQRFLSSNHMSVPRRNV